MHQNSGLKLRINFGSIRNFCSPGRKFFYAFVLIVLIKFCVMLMFLILVWCVWQLTLMTALYGSFFAVFNKFNSLQLIKFFATSVNRLNFKKVNSHELFSFQSTKFSKDVIILSVFTLCCYVQMSSFTSPPK